ncbi:MAG: toprim domain-containing protein [Nanoarchaeota archaeon]
METISEWIKEINNEEIALIVEGKKDINALRKIGVNNPIHPLSKKPIYKIAEEFPQKKVIILTDFDKKGKELYAKLSRELQSWGIKVDYVFREWLQKNTKLSHIEGIDKLI